ncbi:MAG: hypothetical protein PHW82_04220 [Bacteroidales bacterium]|nr:hypothetical protein [Bacteroidales bacterium]
MKKIFYILASVVIVSAISCDNANKKQDKVEAKKENIAETKKIEIKYLEDFLQFDNHEQIVECFGDKNVVKTSLLEDEGTVEYNVSIINPNYRNKVIVYWGEEDDWEQVEFVKNINSIYTNTGSKATAGGDIYPTKVGLEIGMLLGQIQEINGSTFTFYGLGWDYGGFVSKLDAKFDDYKLFVDHQNPDFSTNSPDEYNKLTGDNEFLSTNKDALNVGLQLVSISYMEK